MHYKRPISISAVASFCFCLFYTCILNKTISGLAMVRWDEIRYSLAWPNDRSADRKNKVQQPAPFTLDLSLCIWSTTKSRRCRRRNSTKTSSRGGLACRLYFVIIVSTSQIPFFILCTCCLSFSLSFLPILSLVVAQYSTVRYGTNT